MYGFWDKFPHPHLEPLLPPRCHLAPPLLPPLTPVLPFLPPPSASLQNSLQNLATQDVRLAHQHGWMAAAAVLEDAKQGQLRRHTAAQTRKQTSLAKKAGLQILVSELDKTIARASQTSTPIPQETAETQDRASDTKKVEPTAGPTVAELMAANNKSTTPWKPETNKDSSEVCESEKCKPPGQMETQITLTDVMAACSGRKSPFVSAKFSRGDEDTRQRRNGGYEGDGRGMHRSDVSEQLTVASLVAANAAMRG